MMTDFSRKTMQSALKKKQTKGSINLDFYKFSCDILQNKDKIKTFS